MKKLLLTSLFAIGLISFASAQCTPGPEYGNGVYPDTTTNFIFGCKDVAYEQVISIKVPKDTVIDTLLFSQQLEITAVFDYVKVNSLDGLPNGFAMECNPNNCEFQGNNVGCVVISGTTSDVGTHPLTFHLTAYLNAVLPMPLPPIAMDQPYTLDSYKIVIVEDCGTIGLNDLTKNVTVKVYPNPATDIVTISDLSEYGVKNIHLFNAEGKIVQTYFTESESVSIHTSTFAPGVYFIKVMQNGGQETIRLIID